MPVSPDLPAQLTALLPELTRLARGLTGNRAQAEDLCQEVLLKLWARPDRCAGIDNLHAYALAALRNQYRQNLRMVKTEPLPDDADGIQTELPRALAVIALSELQSAIARLPAGQAHLIGLVIAGETSPDALARLTGLPRGTVMSRLARARATLRGEMGLAAKAPVSDLL